MTVFKTFLRVLNKNKWIVILYTAMLILFGAFNMQTSNNSISFIAEKPDVLIINSDLEEGVTKGLIDYIKENSNIIEVDDTEEARNDALFYRDVNYIIYIPENYREDFLNGADPKIEVKSTGDYQASLAEMILEKYVRLAKIYRENTDSEEELLSKVKETLSENMEVELTSKLDTDSLEKATFYYNFANYSILAGTVYVICIVLSSFKQEKIRKRTVISSMKYKSHNRKLLLSNGLFALFLWLVYVVLSFVLVGDGMFTMHGVVYIVNSFVFTNCALTLAFLIGNFNLNKNAINGVINVIALGSSFLCGSFVPMEWLPDTVLKIAHSLPSYYYISNNEILKTLEEINFETLKPVIGNMVVVLVFTLGFTVLSNMISKKKSKIG